MTWQDIVGSAPAELLLKEDLADDPVDRPAKKGVFGTVPVLLGHVSKLGVALESLM